MLDEDFKVWLIETNTNPSITTPGVILKAYVPRMIDDAFKLTIDKVFGNGEKEGIVDEIGEEKLKQKTFPMVGHVDDENLWDLIDEKI